MSSSRSITAARRWRRSGERVERQAQHLAGQPAHLRQVEIGFELRLVIQIDRRAGDVAGVIGDAFQDGRDLDRRDDQPQVARLRRMDGKQLDAEPIGLQLQRVDAVVVSQHLLRQVRVALYQRPRGMVNGVLDFAAHQQHMIAQFI